MIQRYNGVEEDGDGAFVYFYDHLAVIADKDMEITTCNLALLERDREIERLKYAQWETVRQLNQEVQKNVEIQADLDQVVGEATLFAKAAKSDLITEGTVKRADKFLTSPLVQSWRERQKKEGS